MPTGSPRGRGSTGSATVCGGRASPHTRGIMCTLISPSPSHSISATLEEQFPGSTKGQTLHLLFGCYSMGLQSAINRAWTQNSLLPQCHFMYTFFSTSIRKCCVAVNIHLSHWNRKLQKHLQSHHQRSGPLTIKWHGKKNPRKWQKPFEARWKILMTLQKCPSGQFTLFFQRKTP